MGNFEDRVKRGGRLLAGGLLIAISAQLGVRAQTEGSPSQAEQNLYAQLESHRLKAEGAQERQACNEMLDQFPHGTYAPKAQYRLAMLNLRDATNWGDAIEGLSAVQELYPNTVYASYATQLHQALTDPQNATDLMLLVELYQTTARSSRLGNLEDHPVSETFTIFKLADFYEHHPLLSWLEQSDVLQPADKGQVAIGMAEMMYRAPTRDRMDQAEAICQWILEHCSDDHPVCGSALLILTQIEEDNHQNLTQAEVYCRQLADDEKLKDWGGRAFCRLAHFHSRWDANLEKAYALLTETRQRWPLSRWSYEACQILSRPEFIAAYGAPELSPAEQGWANDSGEQQTASASKSGAAGAASPSAPDNGLREALTQVAQGPGSAAQCGAEAVYLAARQLGKPLSIEQANVLCPARDRRGTNTLGDLSRAFMAQGVASKGVEIGLDELKTELKAQNKAVVVHLPDHFALVHSIAPGVVTLEDGAGTRAMSLARFQLLWDGYALVAQS